MDPVLGTVKFIWPQHGAKFVVKCPAREGKAEVFKCCTFARFSCITSK